MTMNATPNHLDDEILSGLLDGAGDRGSEGDAAAHLAACDRCAARQAELGAARTALATAPVEPLDELSRRRLVAAALQAAEETTPAGSGGRVLRAGGRGGWLTRHPAVVGSAAAVLLGLLVGVPFVVGDDAGSDRTLSAQAPAELRDGSRGTFLGNLGDLSDEAGLRLRLSGRESASDTFAYTPAEPALSPVAGAPGSGAPLPSGAPSGGGLAGTSARSSSPPAPTAGAAEKATQSDETTADGAAGNADQLSSQPGAGGDSAREWAEAEACVAALLDRPARGGRLLRYGVGTYDGRPAVVASFELDGGTVAFVTDRPGCAVLDRFPV
jgi:hypothetical protein